MSREQIPLTINLTTELIEEAQARGLNGKEMIALAIQRQFPDAADILVGDTPPPPNTKGTH